MQNDIMQGFEVFANTLLPLALSFVACLVRQLKFGWHGFFNFLREYVIMAFMGVLVFWSLDYVDLPPTVDAAITTSSAYSGLVLIDALQKATVDWYGKWFGKPPASKA